MYDIVLIEKPGELGLTKAEVMDMYDSLNGDEAYPIEIYNCGGGSSAMGFFWTKQVYWGNSRRHNLRKPFWCLRI